jgi:hypothetical protein
MTHALALTWFLMGCGTVPVGTRDKADAELDTGRPEESTISFGGIEISPGSVDFGTVPIGQDATATVTLTNTDETQTLISNAYVSGGAAFVMVEDVDLPLTMSGGATRALSLVFSPSELTRAHATLYVGVAGEVGYAEVGLAGKGKVGGSNSDDTGSWTGDASLSVSPSSIDFGTVAVLSSSSQVLSMTNTGTADVWITDINITDPAFSVDPGFSPLLIEHGSAATMPLSFAPGAEGLVEAILDIKTDPAEASLYVDLTGIGSVSECSICAPVLSLSSSTGGSSALNLVPPYGYGCTVNGSVVLSNAGDQTLDINQVILRNDTISSCGEFSRSWAGPGSLLPGESTTVVVDYVADGSCLELPYTTLNENLMHIRTSDPELPDAIIELSATVLLCD